MLEFVSPQHSILDEGCGGSYPFEACPGAFAPGQLHLAALIGK